MKPILAVTAAVVLFVAGNSWLRPDQSKSNPVKPDGSNPETIQLIESLDGAALYKAYCAVCHGIDGHGGGPMSASLKVPPTDLTKIAARNGGVYRNARIERIISGEELLPSGHGTRTMPVWGPIFSQIAWDQDLGRLRVHNLADYIAHMQAK